MKPRTQLLFLNVYRAGHYHRQGKPNTTNLHGGDFYTTHDLAVQHAEHERGYLFTVPVEVPVPDGATITVNSETSHPDSLAFTRGNPVALLPWYSAPMPPVCTAGTLCNVSLEPSDADEVIPFEEWQAKAATRKPVHGGYPDVWRGRA